MPGPTITSANAVVTLAIPGLYDTPQRIQGFSADNIFEMDVQELAETSMGIDGRLSAGFVFNPINQTFVLQADSASNAIFETWAKFQQQQIDVLEANGTTTLKSLKKSYVSTRGFLISWPPIAPAARTLQPRRYVIRWQSIQPNPVLL